MSIDGQCNECNGTGRKPALDFYVVHPEGQEVGLRSVKFATREEAQAKRDEWNKDIPGHYILTITRQNATAQASADTNQSKAP